MDALLWPGPHHGYPPPTQGTSVWDVLTALAAIGTTVIAGLALRAAIRAAKAAQGSLDVAEEGLRAERARDQARDKVEERAFQADWVAAWLYFKPKDAFLPGIAFSAIPRPAVVALLRNRSPLPVYDVKVLFYAEGVIVGEGERPILPPEDEGLDVPHSARDAVTPPAPESDGDAGKPKTPRPEYRRLRVGIEFTDTARRRWRRDQYGLLTRVE